MRRKTILFLLISAMTLLVIALLLWGYLPRKESTQLSAICRIETKAYYILADGPHDTLYLNLKTDSLSMDAAADLDSLQTATATQSGVYVSRLGHFFTASTCLQGQPDSLTGPALRERLQRISAKLTQELKALQGRIHRLERYARIHSTIDDGYNEVMAYFESQKRLEAGRLRTLRLLDSLLNQPKLPAAHLKARLQVLTEDSTRQSARLLRHDDQAMLCRLDSARLPQGCARFSVYRLGARAWRSRLTAFNDLGQTTQTATARRILPTDSLLPTSEGGAWINRSGNLCGIESGGHRVSSIRLARLLNEEHFWPTWWWKNLTAWIAELRAPIEQKSSASNSKKKASKSALFSTIYAPDEHSYYQGEVSHGSKGSSLQRQGYGRLIEKDGTVYEGLWQADTLVSGTKLDSLGRYEGTFNRLRQPHGEGLHTAPSGTIYSGTWHNGHKSGLGFAVNDRQIVRCGIWKNDVFKGERMIYTTDRIYGIDISRHQHEKDGHKYPIDWSRLTITGLGSGRRVQGAVNYPVSYIYIKSTEGKTVVNRYYAADLRAARRRGIPVGTYHFYSPYSPSAAQAAHFLKQSSIRKGDLPPVLDLEPTETEVRKMGGDAAMFRGVEQWLRIVSQRTGRRPILYVSQTFIDRHLVHASDYIRGHEVWIARYSEYKPYVHLLHWQLTPHGSVSGIHGEVDINVFNGTKAQFKEYLQNL